MQNTKYMIKSFCDFESHTAIFYALRFQKKLWVVNMHHLEQNNASL